MNNPLRSGLVALFVALSAFASACYSPTLGDGKLACSGSDTCPDGYQCASNGFCYQNGAAVPPDAPTQVTAAPGVRSAQVSWTASASDGGSAITTYTVTASPGGATANTTSASTSATVSGLQNGTAYTFTVVATNAIGDSRASAPSASITTFDFPGAPTNVTASAIAHGASLDWDAPNDTGGTPVTGYIVQVSLNGGDYTHVSPAFSGTHATVTGLSAGGTYTFVVAAVNAVGAGTFSSPSSPLLLADVPAMPVITAPATVSTGDTGVTATVPANAGETYAWTLSGATLTNPDGPAGELGNGVDTITFTVTASSGGQVVLSCVATNAIGSSDAGTFTENVTGAPAQPTIVAADVVTVGDTGITAQVTAHDGMTYNWTLSGNTTLRGSDLHGVTANGLNTITYDLNGNASAGDTVQLSVVEVNPSQQMSAPGTKSQTIAALPVAPAITGPQIVVAGETGASASVVARAGMTYAWTLTGATFSSGSTSAGITSGGTNSILFDVTAASGSVGLSVVETNAALKSGSPGTLAVPIGALPSPLTIGVALDNGASPAQFQSGATQYATAGATSVQAQIASVPNATYAWNIVSGGVSLHSGETGTAHTVLLDFDGTPGSAVISCTVTLASSSATATQALTLVAAPVAPAITLDNSGASLQIPAGDVNGRSAAIVSPVSTSTYAWSASPSAKVAQIGASGTQVSFNLAAGTQAGDTISINAVETNAAGHAGTAGTATVTIIADLAAPTFTVSNSAVANGPTYTATQTSTRASGVTYQWSIVEAVDGVLGQQTICLDNALPNGPVSCTDNGDGTMSFKSDPALEVGHGSLIIHLDSQDQFNQTASAQTVTLPVIALPVTTIAFGAPPSGDTFGANITAGSTREAYVTQSADTFAWSVSPGAIVSGGSTNDVTFNAGSAQAGATLTLTLTTTNAAGSSTSNATVTVVAPGAGPTIVAADAVTLGDTGIAAAVAAVTGTTYTWTVSSNATLTTSANGVTSGGFNMISYDLNGAAAVGDNVVISVTAEDADEQTSAPSTKSQVIAAVPVSPAITAPVSVAAGETGASASVPARANMTYAWTLTGATFSSGSGAAGSTSGGVNSILFDVTASAGNNVVLSVIETNLATKSGQPSTQNVPVTALPNPLTIGVALDNGASPAQFQSGATQYATQSASAVQARVPTVPGATYAWQIVSGGAVLHSGETGTASTFNFDVTGTPGDSNTGTIQLACTVSVGSSSVQGTQAVTIVAAPAIPTVSIDGNGASAFISAGDTSTHHAAVSAPVSTSTYAWSAAPSADLASIGASGTTVPFVLSSSAAAGANVTISAVETNAAGHVGTTAGTAALSVVAAPAMPVITPSNSAVAAGQSYTASYGTAQANTSYVWSIAEVANGVVGAAVACPSSGANGCAVNGDGSLSFNVDNALPADGNHAIELQLVAQNQADATSSATPVDLDVIALPVATIQFGAQPSGDAFGATITAGGTREAFVAQSPNSFVWSVTPGSIVSGGTTNDVIFSAGSAAAGSTLALSLIATNAAGSTTASATVNVVAAASAPTIAVPPFATDPNPAVGAFASHEYTATLAAGANPGTSYRWTVTGGTQCNGDGSLCGIALADSSNPATGSFEYTVNAQLGSTLTFSAVAIDAAGDASASSTTVTQSVIAAPQPPTIESTFTTPGAPDGATFTDFAPGGTYDLTITAPHTGMTYLWSGPRSTCPATGSTFCTDQSGNATYSTIELIANASITGSALNPGDTVTLTAAEMNLAGDLANSAPLEVSVIAAPPSGAPIVLIDDIGNLLNGTTNPKVVTDGQNATAYVDTNPDQPETYFWSATNSISGMTNLVTPPGASGQAGTGFDSEAVNEILVLAPAYVGGETIAIDVTACNDAACSAADTPATLTVEPQPTAPTITVSALNSDVRSPQALTYGATSVGGNFVDGQNADGSAMVVNCVSQDANSSVESGSIDYTANFSFAFDISASPTSVDGSGDINTTLLCIETNAAGDSNSAQLIIPLAPPLAVAAFSPLDGTTDVPATVAPSVLFSYAPNASSLTLDASCSGTTNTVTFVDTTSGLCVPAQLAQDANTFALFTITPSAPLNPGDSYTLTVVGGSGGVVDLQGVPLPASASISFQVHFPPDIAMGTIRTTPHLQSIDLAWTNPSDPQLDHVYITATPTSGGSPIAIDSATGATSATVSGLAPMTQYTLTLQVAEAPNDASLSAGVQVSATTAFSGFESDFTATQVLTGLGPSFNGTGAEKFYITWDANNLYVGLEQSDTNTPALRNNGDSFWVAIDTDGAGNDVNGVSSSNIIGVVTSGVQRQILWPFNADYVIQLQYQNDGQGTALNANVVYMNPENGNTTTPISSAVTTNGNLAELMIPSASLTPPDDNDRAPKRHPFDATAPTPRFAMAFLNSSNDIHSGGFVIDVAPASYASDTTDGHTPATDVIGPLASITNSVAANLFDPTQTNGSISGSTRSPSDALVTVSFDTTAQNFPSTDQVQLMGNLPPLSYTLADSSYFLANDGTRGSAANSAGIYTGVFNFGVFAAEESGTNTNELFFKLADNGNAAEPLFQPSGTDRVWTLTGATESVGDGTNPLVFNQVFSASNPFALTFMVTNPEGPTSNVVTGSAAELGTWTPTSGVALMATQDQANDWITSSISFAAQDFVSNPLQFKAYSTDFDDPDSAGYEPGPNNFMNDDVLNTRLLTWTWGVEQNF